MKQPTAVVMNMFHSGLGIARSLGERGVPVVGLTAKRGVYGNATRYAKVILCPDSRSEPEALLERLLKLKREIGQGVIFPTRDDDVVFLDRFRDELKGYLSPVIPPRPALTACLNKWETHHWAQRVGVSAPKCWLIEGEQELSRRLPEVTYPCVLKPVASYHWHRGQNWQLVGGRKAVCVASEQELIAEYRAIARADSQALLEEAVQGSDDCLLIAACYLDRQSNYVAGFNAQKLLQTPEGYGTGCIVQTTERPELFEPTVRLLKEMGFSGIAEVEYKWDRAAGEYKLIEINPRPWDQHRLGNAIGVDLMYLAYCDHAGLAMPVVKREASTIKWVAEDAFISAVLSSVRQHDQKLRKMMRLARGKRICAVWSLKDPAPFVVLTVRTLIPRLIGSGLRLLSLVLERIVRGRKTPRKQVQTYENSLEKR